MRMLYSINCSCVKKFFVLCFFLVNIIFLENYFSIQLLDPNLHVRMPTAKTRCFACFFVIRKPVGDVCSEFGKGIYHRKHFRILFGVVSCCMKDRCSLFSSSASSG